MQCRPRPLVGQLWGIDEGHEGLVVDFDHWLDELGSVARLSWKPSFWGGWHVPGREAVGRRGWAILHVNLLLVTSRSPLCLSRLGSDAGARGVLVYDMAF